MLKKMLMTVSVVTVAFWCVSSAMAQDYDEYQFTEGTKEFILSGSGASDNDLDATTAAVQLSWGYFMTDNWEISVRQEVGVSDTPEDSDWSGSTRLIVDYHFDLDRWQPFVGAGIGYLYGDSVEEQFIAGPEVGLKYFLQEDAFAFGMIEYQFLFDDKDEADEAFDDGRFVYSVGMGITF